MTETQPEAGATSNVPNDRDPFAGVLGMLRLIWMMLFTSGGAARVDAMMAETEAEAAQTLLRIALAMSGRTDVSMDDLRCSLVLGEDGTLDLRVEPHNPAPVRRPQPRRSALRRAGLRLSRIRHALEHLHGSRIQPRVRALSQRAAAAVREALGAPTPVVAPP